MSGNYKIIQSLARAFSIIDCFTNEDKELTLNEISQKVDLNINTTRGLVQTLMQYNYLSFDGQDRLYRLGSIFLEKSDIAQFDYTEKIIELISEDLQLIADKYYVSSRFHSVENLNITTVIERRASRSRYMLSIRNQTNFPLNASASGKLILAHLKSIQLDEVLSNMNWEKYGKNTILNREDLEKEINKIAENDVSVEEDELGDGYSSIAIPVFKDAELAYTLSIVSTTQLVTESYHEVLKELREIREKIYGLAEFK